VSREGGECGERESRENSVHDGHPKTVCGA
jgi:hypothetical protein